MDLDNLISQITNIVMDRLQKESINKTKFLVLSNQDNKELESVLGNTVSLEYFNSMNQVYSCDGIICPYVCCMGLSNIARGTASGELQAAYLQAIILNKRLYQLKEGVEYHSYKGTMPAALLGLYQEYESALRSYGVKFVTLQELKDDVLSCGNNLKEVISSSEAPLKATRQLITEKMVKSLYDNGTKELRIGKHDIITPLAEDFIRKSNIDVNRS